MMPAITTCLRIIPLLLTAAILCSCRHDAESALPALRQLDRVLATPDTFAASRRNRIAVLSADLRTVTSHDDRYNIYRGLYGQYRRFRIDSAMLIAEDRLREARLCGGKRIISASLNLAESYSDMGNYHETLDILDTIPRIGLEPYQLKYLYNIYGTTYQRLANRDAIGTHKLAYATQVKNYRDSSLNLYSGSEPSYYYIRAWQMMDAGRWKEALETVERLEERFQPDPTADHLAQKAEIYRHLGLRKEEITCLAMAAETDITSGRKEAGNLTRLALSLNETGDVDRAYNYIRRALRDVRFSHAHAASADVLEAIPIIENAHHEAERGRIIHISLLSGIILMMAIGLAVALRLAHRHLENNRRMRESLEKNNQQLAEINKALSKANEARTGYINDIFGAYSGYIEQISSFRKNLSRLLTVRKYSEALDLLRDNTIESRELQEMYSRFDTVFLNLCPSFIEEYNALVRPEERLDPYATTLSAPLRMIALMKLGITSTRRLAETLHYNTQTIYNYRARIKAALSVDKETFDIWLAVHPAPLPPVND